MTHTYSDLNQYNQYKLIAVSLTCPVMYGLVPHTSSTWQYTEFDR